MKELSKISKELKPSQIMDFFSMVLKEKDCISFCVGQPNFKTPDHIAKVAADSIIDGKNFYTNEYGIEELRVELSKLLNRKYNINYKAEEILLTIGASEAIDLICRTLINPGDEVIVFDPVYDAYVPCIKLNGGIDVHVKLKKENDYKVDPKDLEAKITSKTKAIILNYPNNPTGAIMRLKDLEGVAKICAKHDLYVISDEIYSELTYEGAHESISSLDNMKERTIVINGFSKAYAMTGFRLGYICAPIDIINVMRNIHSYTMVCCPSVSQYAGVEAVKNGDSDISYMKEEYNKRRIYAYDRLKNMGLDCYKSTGAFYLFPSIKEFGMDSLEFATRLFKEYGVAVVPGSAFGEAGKYNIRISYTCSYESIVSGMDKLEEFVKSLRNNK